MKKCDIFLNKAINLGAAGITNGIFVIASILIFELCNIKDNIALTTGGFYIATLYFSTEFRNCTFLNNKATSIKEGGACIYSENKHDIFTYFSIFSSNYAKNIGGFAFFLNGQYSDFQSVFYNNSASFGGVLTVISAVNVKMEFSKLLKSKSIKAGGIFYMMQESQIELISVKISDS